MDRSPRTAAVILVALVALLASGCASGIDRGEAPAAMTASPAADTSSTSAPRPPADPSMAPADGANPQAPAYTIEQALSDRAQETTIAFDALGFLTGNLGSDSFFPPGKVADFWGFQYLRDNDPTSMGHNTDFLTSAALNVLDVLDAEQRGQLLDLARSQVGAINDYGLDRLVLIKAFRRLLDGDLPAGTTGLDLEAVMAYSADLYELDGQISYERAAAMGPILAGLTDAQRTSLDAMAGTGMADWPSVEEAPELRNLSRDEKVAVMTYAADLFSWYAGSVEADVYFCPERHGTYFGSFYLKDAPAVGNPGYSIDTRLTADLGATMLEELDATQAGLVRELVGHQRSSLVKIVATRRDVATELRSFLAGDTADRTAVLSDMRTYGELDGQIAFDLATAFAKVGNSLTDDQKAALTVLRTRLLGNLSSPEGAFLYAQPIAMPPLPNTDFLFE